MTFTLLQDQNLVSPGVKSSVRLDLKDASNWRAFRTQVIAKSDIEGDHLDQKRSYVKACVQQSLKDENKAAKSKAHTYGTSTSDGAEVQIPASARLKGTYNPWKIPWYCAIGSSYLRLTPVLLGNDIPPTYRYRLPINALKRTSLPSLSKFDELESARQVAVFKTS